MRLLFALLVALLVSGCASTRAPGTLVPPTSLAGVNEVLADKRATVVFADGRSPERAFVKMGPDLTELRRAPSRRARARRVPTSEIAFIEIDDSQSVGEGAGVGIGYGLLPGLGVAAVGLGAAAQCDTFGCGVGATSLLVGGGAAAVVGGLVGAAVGGSSTSRRYSVIVYEGPVSRYPDAGVEAAPASAPR